MNTDKDYYQQQDQLDPLKALRQEFYFPQTADKKDVIYLCGNSLGLQSKSSRSELQYEIESWAQYGVEGHFDSKTPWFSYHESVREQLSTIVGALPCEVVAMNSLSVNLHLLMASFYRPTKNKFKILIEANAFPSDRYAVMSQLRFHGFDPQEGLIEVAPLDGQSYLTTENILQTIRDNKDELALILFSGVQYLSGQCFDLAALTKCAHQNDIMIGFDLAHSVGNVEVALHDWQVDFAAWCSYKYLNAGPGGIAGVYIHESHCRDQTINRFEGWWGNDPGTRFKMMHDFKAVESADAWQLSNPPIFQLAALKGSLDVFAKTNMQALAQKGLLQVSYLSYLLQTLLADSVEIITPLQKGMHGNQLSLKLSAPSQDIQKQLMEQGVITDFRAPDVLRIAVAPLYTRYVDCYEFVMKLKSLLG